MTLWGEKDQSPAAFPSIGNAEQTKFAKPCLRRWTKSARWACGTKSSFRVFHFRDFLAPHAFRGEFNDVSGKSPKLYKVKNALTQHLHRVLVFINYFCCLARILKATLEHGKKQVKQELAAGKFDVNLPTWKVYQLCFMWLPWRTVLLEMRSPLHNFFMLFFSSFYCCLELRVLFGLSFDSQIHSQCQQ